MLWGLFSQNAFRALQDLMKEVLAAVDLAKDLFEALSVGDQDKISQIAKEISQVEHNCDKIKQDLRAQISKSVFLPVDKRDMIHVLSHMDGLANICEDLGVLLTLRKMELPVFLKEPLDELLQRSFDTVAAASEVISKLDRLLETGFSGHDSVKIQKKIDEIDHLEHLADKAQDQFGKILFQHEDDLKPAALLMWNKISNKIGDLPNNAERMTAHIRLMLSQN